jgi:hypothetical protein
MRAAPPRDSSFPPGVATKLRTCVYRLIDPRNGETFYIGLDPISWTLSKEGYDVHDGHNSDATPGAATVQ